MASSRLITELNKKKNLWIDSSETDLSTTSDNEFHSTSSTIQIPKSSKVSCCLICSILSSLSNVNCCSKHLTLLTKTSKQIINEISQQVDSHKSKSKQKPRVRSLSSVKSSNEKRKQPLSLTSSNTIQKNYVLRSLRSKTRQQYRSKNIQIPSPPPPLAKKKRTRAFSSPVTTKRSPRNTVQGKSTIENRPRNNSPTPSDPDLLFIPRVSLKRVIHVKDDDEFIDSDSQIILNMTQATRQMGIQEDSQPKIFLKRIRLEK